MPLFRKKEPPPVVSAVVAAAGCASRMGGIDKQTAMLGDMPVVAHSISRLQESAYITEIIVVCREQSIANYYAMVNDYGFTKIKSIVAGGENRQLSVFAGIESCSEDAALYVIHDGARPLVSPQQIDDCIELAFETGAAALGVAVKDTIKVCDESGKVLSTPRRGSLWAVQTPQIFSAKLYRQAMAKALHEEFAGTDDCQLVEALGHPVMIYPASYENIKITTPEDISIAQAILNYRQEGLTQWEYE